MLKQFLMTALCGTLLIPNVTFVHAEETKYENDGHVKASGISVTYRSEAEIREYVRQNGPQYLSPAYITEPNYTNAPYEPGELSQEALDDALKAVNTVRFIAGLDHKVVLENSYTEKVQAGALLNAINGKLTHDPDKPAGVDDELYKKGLEGFGSANIAWNNANLSSAVTNGWLNDGDTYNIEKIGHRRWLLNAAMGKTGFGAVGTYSGMWAHDTSGSNELTSNVWPAQNTPVEFFTSEYPWSVSTGNDESIGDVIVTMTDANNKKYEFYKGCKDGYFNINNENYGEKGAIIWRPADISYNAGDEYKVEIKNLAGGKSISYTVNFFKLYGSESMSVSPTSLEIGVGEKATITASFNPMTNKSFIHSCGAMYYSSSKTFDYKTSDDLRSVIVTGIAAGSGILTIEGANGLSCECSVNVVEKPVAVTSVSLDQHELSLLPNNTKQLTATILPENATNKNITWTSSNEAVATVDSNGLVTAHQAGTATIKAQSAENADVYDECVITVREITTLTGASLSLNGYIGVNFYFEIPEKELNDIVIVLKLGTAEKRINAMDAGIPKDTESGNRKIQCVLHAKQLRDKITLHLEDKTGNTKELYSASGTDYTEGFSYAAVDYINTVSKMESTGTQLKELLNALDVYGQWAQKRAGYNAEQVDPKEITDVSLTENLGTYQPKTSGELNEVSLGASLSLNSGTNINVYAYLPEGADVTDYKFSIDGKEVTPVYNSAEKAYIFRVINIHAKNLGTAHTFSVEKDGAVRSIKYSALSYAYTVVDLYSGNEEYFNLVNTVKALYHYYTSAAAYFKE